MNKNSKIYNIGLFKRLLTYVKSYRNIFVFSIFSVFGLSIFSAIRPVVLEKIVDENITKYSSEYFIEYILIMLLLLVMEVVCNYLFIFNAGTLGQFVVRDIRVTLFNHIQGFKMKYYDKSSVGILITRTVTDMERIADIFGQGLFLIVSDILKMLLVSIVMISMNWELSLIVFISLPFILLATKIFQKYMKSAFDQVRNEVANLNSFVQERVTGINILQLFAREEIEFKKFKKINHRHKNAWLKTVWYNSIFFPVAEIFSSLTLGLVVWYGGMNTVLDNSASLGELTAFIMMIPMLFRPLNQIANKFNTLLMGMVAAERVFKILDTESKINDNGLKKADNIKGEIIYENVSFSYIKEDKLIENFNLKIKSGSTNAIVGATGSGKSTIIKLLNRFYNIDKGKIYIDDINISEYSISSLRKNIGFVSQDVHLFTDSILNNITLKNNDIPFIRVKNAAKKIKIDSFISSLPGGYNYNVKERGVSLSTGQRQLISFLRVYIKNPQILVLDEATSSVDTDSELLLQNAIEQITKNRTSIIIAHRLSTIMKADNIVVMDKGKIVESGKHSELIIKKNGYYKKLYNSQLNKETNLVIG
ncbi:MAG: antibiotic ABC transporter ATP-binding protein [Flavobacteriaceae bacterium]|nr:antibiotic ABC transporter ATP-binding protein [Flavobacteriaceae bacterium]|tara:strand:- start:15672 stop:17444 length:1773 start_codon:yes stop_codon:yes gene_type:complete